MTNIFNKKVLVENGTLINNWFEEEALKKVTGETRTVPGFHTKKKHLDTDLIITPGNITKDDTKLRIMGVNRIAPYTSTNMFYGDFSSEEHKFNKIGVKEKIFKEFFTSYLTNEKADKNSHSSNVKSARMNESTYKSSFIKQPLITKIGSRHMQTQDLVPIDQSGLDKYFMASHDMGKYSKVLPEDKIKGYFDMSVPYYNDKALTFWNQNCEKSNVYHSHRKGENEFARSSGFTQPLNLTKGSECYHGNVSNDKQSRYVYVHQEATDFEALESKMRKRVEDLSGAVREKFLSVMYKKGWLAIRKYKLFLLNLSKRKTTLIEKSDFKYFSTNFGVYFSDQEVDFIYNLFDFDKNSKICYETFIEGLIKTPNKERTELIEKFCDYAFEKTLQEKPTYKYISLTVLDRLFNANKHPEALNYQKVADEIKLDFVNLWNKEREDDLIKKDNFWLYFDDVSQSVKDDNSFIQILGAFGFNK